MRDWTGAPCLTNDPDYWFSDHESDKQLAKSLCQTCPFIAECEEKGKDEESGIWGGVDMAPAEEREPTTNAERVVVRTARREGKKLERLQRLQEAQRLVSEGLSMREIGKRLNVNHSNVVRLLRNADTINSEETAA